MESPYTFYQAYPINVLTKDMIRAGVADGVGYGLDKEFNWSEGLMVTSARMCEWLPLCRHRPLETLYQPLEGGRIHHSEINCVRIIPSPWNNQVSGAFYFDLTVAPIAIDTETSLVKSRMDSETSVYSGSLYLAQICSFLPTLEIVMIRSIQNEFYKSRIAQVRAWAHCCIQIDMFQSFNTLLPMELPLERKDAWMYQKLVCNLNTSDIQRVCVRIHGDADTTAKLTKSDRAKRPSFYALFFKRLDKWKSCTENLHERFPIQDTEISYSADMFRTLSRALRRRAVATDPDEVVTTPHGLFAELDEEVVTVTEPEQVAEQPAEAMEEQPAAAVAEQPAAAMADPPAVAAQPIVLPLVSNCTKSNRIFHDGDHDYYLLGLVPIMYNKPYHDLPAQFCSMADRITFTAAQAQVIPTFQITTVKFESVQAFSLNRWAKRYNNMRQSTLTGQGKPHTSVVKNILKFLTRIDQDPLRTALLLPRLTYYHREREGKKPTGKCWLIYPRGQVSGGPTPSGSTTGVISTGVTTTSAPTTSAPTTSAKESKKSKKTSTQAKGEGNMSIKVRSWQPLDFIGDLPPAKEFPVEPTASGDHVAVYLPNTNVIPASGPRLSVIEIE